MNALGALLYLEGARLRNFFLASLRQPSRLVLWIAAIGVVIFFSWSRAARSGRATAHVMLADPFATIVGFAAIAALGIIAGGAGGGAVGTFYDAADARYLTMSSLPERAVVLWLQLRNSILTLLRLGFAMLMYALFFARGSSAGAFFAMTGGLFLATMMPLPVFEAARHTSRTLIRGIGYALATLSALCAAVVGGALAFPQLQEISARLIALHVGTVASLLWRGDSHALLALYGAALALLLIGVSAAYDVYPELYEAAMKFGGGSRRRWLAMHRPEKGRKSASSSSTRASGVWTYFWKERITVSRAPALRMMFFIELAVGVIGGAIAGVAAKGRPEVLGGLVGGIGAALIILLAASGTSLARDVSKPIWWMGAGSTFAKVAAWCWATSLDSTIVFAGGLTAMSLGSGLRGLLYLGLPAALVLPPLIRAVGVVTYTFFPSAIDQRGPIAALRIFVIYGCLVPPIAAGILGGIFAHNAMIGFLCAFAVLIVEGSACLWIAASKLEGRGAEFAIAETR